MMPKLFLFVFSCLVCVYGQISFESPVLEDQPFESQIVTPYAVTEHKIEGNPEKDLKTCTNDEKEVCFTEVVSRTVALYAAGISQSYAELEVAFTNSEKKKFSLSSHPTEADNINVLNEGIFEPNFAVSRIISTATVLEVPIQNSIVVPLEADICDSTGPDNCVKANTDNTYTMYVSGVGRRQKEMVCKTAGDAITFTLSTLQPTAGTTIKVIKGVITERRLEMARPPTECTVTKADALAAKPLTKQKGCEDKTKGNCFENKVVKTNTTIKSLGIDSDLTVFLRESISRFVKVTYKPVEGGAASLKCFLQPIVAASFCLLFRLF